MTLKTLKDIFWGEITNRCLCGSCDEGMGCDIKKIKKESIKWIKEIRKKSKAHWKELDEKTYIGMDNPFSWELDGLTFNDWHEAADPSAAIMILKHFFNITEEDLK